MAVLVAGRAALGNRDRGAADAGHTVTIVTKKKNMQLS